jgi:hypothetical protein
LFNAALLRFILDKPREADFRPRTEWPMGTPMFRMTYEYCFSKDKDMIRLEVEAKDMKKTIQRSACEAYI